MSDIDEAERVSEQIHRNWTGAQPLSWVVIDGVLSVFDVNGKLLATGDPEKVVAYFNQKE